MNLSFKGIQVMDRSLFFLFTVTVLLGCTNKTQSPTEPEHTTLQKSSSQSLIAFHSSRDNNNNNIADVYIVAEDGSGLTNLTNDPSTNDRNPEWSPDGSRIAFQTDRDGNDEIYIMNADGTGLFRLTNHAARDHKPAWSPDGSKIAFTSDRDAGFEIYSINASGGPTTRLTDASGLSGRPDWAPSSKIVFETTRDGSAEVYIMNDDGSGQTRLTTNPGGGLRPSWSPDELTIVYAKQDGSAIWKVDADGSNQTQVFSFSGSAHDAPDWSPDGTRIVFGSSANGNPGLYIINADGYAPIRLTNNATDSRPSWMPGALNVEVDIKPQSCPNPINSKSKGVLPVAILGTSNFYVTEIDVSSLELEGVPPLRSNIEDETAPIINRREVCDCTTSGPDGFDDLTLKFSTQVIIAALGSINDGDEVILRLTGNLNNGTPIEGKDCVIIKKK